jgi:hypothetical protein
LYELRRSDPDGRRPESYVDEEGSMAIHTVLDDRAGHALPTHPVRMYGDRTHLSDHRTILAQKPGDDWSATPTFRGATSDCTLGKEILSFLLWYDPHDTLSKEILQSLGAYRET